MKRRLLVVLILGFSSGLPLNLLTSTLQAWFSQAGLSVMETGLLSLIGLPYIFRALLAPALDRYTLFSLGKRRSWVAMMHIFLFIGLNVLAWCSPSTSAHFMACTALTLAFCSAIQDAAIDAHRTEYLPAKAHGIGVSLAVTGYRLALLVAGGLALFIAASSGWQVSYHIMSLFLIPGFLCVLFTQEPSSEYSDTTDFVTAFIKPFKALLMRRGIVLLLFFVFFYKLGEAFTTSTSGIVMPFLIQGMGFSLDTIALVNKVIGIIAIICGGLIGGLILLRCSLFKSLMAFGILQATTNALFVLLAIKGKSVPLLATAVIFDNLAAGMGTTALLALFMRLVDKHYTATQLSILIAISTIPRVISGPLAASIQSSFGWVGMYQISVILALLFIPFLLLVRGPFDLGLSISMPYFPITGRSRKGA